jgi:transcriptional regulator with XRE-family HTH domain
MTIASRTADAPLPTLLRRRRQAVLPAPARRREIRDSAKLTREEIAAALRAEGHNITAASVLGWEKEKSAGGWDPRRDRAIAYRRLLEHIEAEISQLAAVGDGLRQSESANTQK